MGQIIPASLVMKISTGIKIVASAVLIVLGICFGPMLFGPWSPMNCEHEDIDLDTGRSRTTHMRFFVPVSRSFEHTPISEVLEISDLDSPTGNWKRVNTFSPGVTHSPHYRYHSALYQCYQLQMIWNSNRFSDDAREASARYVLRQWKESERDDGAREFLWRFQEVFNEEISLKDIRLIVARLEEERELSEQFRGE